MSLGGPLRPGTTAFTALEDLSDKIEKAIGPQGREQLKAIDNCFYSYEKHAYSEASRELIWRIVAAIEQRRICRVSYRRPQAEPRDKPIEVLPLRIFAHQGAAYLMCQFVKHATLGTLNLQRVQGLEVLPQQGVIPADFDPAKMEWSAFGVHTGSALVTYKLRFDAEVAAYIRERTWHPSQVLTELERGAVELRFTCGESWEVSSWVASWRQHVEVLEPAQLRTELRALGAVLVERYPAEAMPSLPEPS
jgi:predicted DNA-binding transcriptional regulator YafY